MRRANKDPASTILLNKLIYQENNSTKNRMISEILLKEQKNFCAYTDEYISVTDAKDVEHFNPSFKNTSKDNYSNWFIVKHQWNKEKASKWNNFQPIMHPTADDFEERIIYLEGDYLVSSELDVEAKNLISLLQLDNVLLAEKRKIYIERRKKHIEISNMEARLYFKELISEEPFNVHYTRAIKEEFGIDVWEMIN